MTTSKFLEARTSARGRSFKIHLDKTKFEKDPRGNDTTTPDPAYVREYTYGADVSRATALKEVRLLAAEALARLEAGDTKMPEEGKEL